MKLCKWQSFFIHRWEWEYPKPEDCSRNRKCRVCGHISGTDSCHQWEWTYIKPDECIQECRCSRCKQQKETRIQHQWIEPMEYETESRRSRTCRRCNKKIIEEKRTYTHTEIVQVGYTDPGSGYAEEEVTEEWWEENEGCSGGAPDSVQ